MKSSPNAPPDSSLRVLENVVVSVVIGIALVAFVAAAIPALWNGRLGVSQFQDDAFYYLVPAKHFLQSGTFTFDGITPTNGFHPLWMAVVVFLVKSTGVLAAPDAHLLAVKAAEKVVHGVAVVTCLALFFRLCRRGEPAGTGFVAIVVLLLCPFYVIFEQGMETTLAVCLFVFAIYAFVSDRVVLLGVVLALLSLCRLDTALFIGLPLALWTLIEAGAGWRGRIMALLPLIVVMAVVTSWNFVTTGHATPISGAIKSSFPVITWHGAFLLEPLSVARMHGWRTLIHGINILLCSALLLAGFVFVLGSGVDARMRAKYSIIGSVAVLLLANLVLFQKWEKSIDPRYLALPMTAAAFLVGATLDACTRRIARYCAREQSSIAARREDIVARTPWRRSVALLPAAVIGMLIAMEANAWLVRFDASFHQREDPMRALFLEVAATLPKDAVIAGTDAGALAFWTQRRVVNLDGVMNDFQYQRTLRDGKLLAYLREQGVTHISTGLWDRRQDYTGRPTEPMYRHQIDPAAVRGRDYACHDFYVYSYVHRVYSDHFCLSPQDEIFRRFLGKDGVADAAYVVYRFGPSISERPIAGSHQPDPTLRPGPLSEFAVAFSRSRQVAKNMTATSEAPTTYVLGERRAYTTGSSIISPRNALSHAYETQ